uniref:Uncharacterized protein n=1 Tax=Cacopsylla melanoneura TaxID=428564 RepID=A0A8D9B0M4_9HEMI
MLITSLLMLSMYYKIVVHHFDVKFFRFELLHVQVDLQSLLVDQIVGHPTILRLCVSRGSQVPRAEGGAQNTRCCQTEVVAIVVGSARCQAGVVIVVVGGEAKVLVVDVGKRNIIEF